jgi:hypothetical protein
MGLDTYSSKEELDYGKIELCGGMMSANGQGSFRGKVYSDFIEKVTGESLYQEKISNKTVRTMSFKLTKYIEDNTEETHNPDLYEWEVTWEDAKNLAKWFRATAWDDADVLGWW